MPRRTTRWERATRCSACAITSSGSPKRLNRPIIVIVDDLDRCNAKFVTELVRGMQTILASPRVVYVLLGDRDWIERAFAEVNKEMKAIDVGAEHSFGGRFVEKAIQLSMVLPAMTGDVREGYVEFLLTGKHRMADPAAAPETPASRRPRVRSRQCPEECPRHCNAGGPGVC
jgi:hypothetical protein